MIRFTLLLLALIFGLGLYAQSKDTLLVKPQKTRTITFKEIYAIDSTQSIVESPLLISFEGIGIKQIKKAYKLNRQAVDSILVADALKSNIWRVYGYQLVHVFVQAKKGPAMAMSLFFPWFVIVFVIIIVFKSIKIFLFRPELIDAEKPKNTPKISK